jgi:hypothetical protein
MSDARVQYIQDRLEAGLDGFSPTPSVASFLDQTKNKQVSPRPTHEKHALPIRRLWFLDGQMQSAPDPGCTCLRLSGSGSYPVRMGINLERCMSRSCKTFSKAGRTPSASSSSFARFSPRFYFSPAPFQQRHDVTENRRACSLVHQRHVLNQGVF